MFLLPFAPFFGWCWCHITWSLLLTEPPAPSRASCSSLRARCVHRGLPLHSWQGKNVPRCLKSTQRTSSADDIDSKYQEVTGHFWNPQGPRSPVGWVQAGTAGAQLSSARLAAWCPRAICIFHIALVQMSFNMCVANKTKRPTACCAGWGNEHGFYHSISPNADRRGHLPEHTQPCGEVCSSSAPCPHLPMHLRQVVLSLCPTISYHSPNSADT